jgi:hypothetical protein
LNIACLKTSLVSIAIFQSEQHHRPSFTQKMGVVRCTTYVKRELIFFSINSHRFNTFVKIHTFFCLPFNILAIDSFFSFCLLPCSVCFFHSFSLLCLFLSFSFTLHISLIFRSVLFWIVDHDAFIRSMWKGFGCLTFQTVFFVSTHNRRVE